VLGVYIFCLSGYLSKRSYVMSASTTDGGKRREMNCWKREKNEEEIRGEDLKSGRDKVNNRMEILGYTDVSQ